MEGQVLNLLEEYFSTLEKTGYVPYGETYRLLAINLLNDLVNVPYAIMSSDQEECLRAALEKLYSCSCLASHFIFGKCCCKDGM